MTAKVVRDKGVVFAVRFWLRGAVRLVGDKAGRAHEGEESLHGFCIPHQGPVDEGANQCLPLRQRAYSPALPNRDGLIEGVFDDGLQAPAASAVTLGIP